LNAESVLPQLIKVFDLLDLSPPLELSDASIPEAWRWAIARWNISRLPKRLQLALER
jgi:hypothetical protein